MDGATHSARALLVTWANQQDHWVRGVASEILEARRALSEERVATFYERFLVEKELASGTKEDVPPLVWNEGSAEKAESLVLRMLESVEGVNALTAGQRITFNNHMTVVFGENGAGKTGYVRILKRVASVRTAEDILPNVGGGKDAVARATITYALADKDAEPLDWRGTKGIPPLTRMDIFDASAVDLHIDEDLTHVYTPSDISLIRFVHDALEAVKSKIEVARQARAPKANPFLVRFARDTAVYTKVEALGPATDLRGLQDLANVRAEDEAELPALRERVEALRSQTPEARASQLRADRDVTSRLVDLVATLRSFDVAEYERLRAVLASASDRHHRASRSAFEGVDIPGVLGPTWHSFVEAGEAYIREHVEGHYPAHNDPCIYCRQPLAEEAVALVRKLREYADGALKKEVETSQAAMDNYSRTLLASKVPELRAAVEARVQSPLTSSIVSFLSAVESFRSKVSLREPATTEGSAVQSLMLPVSDAIESEQEEIDLLLGDLQAQATARARALSEELARQRHLEARVVLRDHLADIEAHVASAKWAESVQPFVKSRIPQLQKALTELSKVASERLLNQDFEQRFRTECEALRAPSVRLDFPGKKGQPARRKVLAPGHRLSAILSEGEQKALALADFLAEASLKGSSTPLVFDDPVTSLDYKRHLHVADRLVELSRERQVIVFTHNIWFTTEMLSRFEKNDALRKRCSYYSVGGDGIGVIAKGTHPRADTYGTMRGKLNSLLQDAAKLEGEMLEAMVERGYGMLRGICEVVVETDLFRGVVQRYQPNIRMTLLEQIVPDAFSACSKTILDVFERACRVIEAHSQPLETLNVRPTLSALRADWDSIEKARQAYVDAVNKAAVS